MKQFSLSTITGFVFGMALIAYSAFAWTVPTQAPPNGNVQPPLNTGSVDQIKNAGLGMNTLAVYGNASILGSLFVNGQQITANTGSKWDISSFFRPIQGTIAGGFMPYAVGWNAFAPLTGSPTSLTAGVTDYLLGELYAGKPTQNVQVGYYLGSSDLSGYTRLDAFRGVNRLYGKIPVAVGLPTPANLTGGTDEDLRDTITSETSDINVKSYPTTDDKTYLQWDMGSSYSGFLVLGGTATALTQNDPTTVVIKVSPDGVNWATEKTFINSGNSSTAESFSLAVNETTRYIRVSVYVVGSTSGHSYNIQEVAFFDTSQANTGRFLASESFIIGSDITGPLPSPPIPRGISGPSMKIGPTVPLGEYTMLVLHIDTPTSETLHAPLVYYQGISS